MPELPNAAAEQAARDFIDYLASEGVDVRRLQASSVLGVGAPDAPITESLAIPPEVIEQTPDEIKNAFGEALWAEVEERVLGRTPTPPSEAPSPPPVESSEPPEPPPARLDVDPYARLSSDPIGGEAGLEVDGVLPLGADAALSTEVDAGVVGDLVGQDLYSRLDAEARLEVTNADGTVRLDLAGEYDRVDPLVGDATGQERVAGSARLTATDGATTLSAGVAYEDQTVGDVDTTTLRADGSVTYTTPETTASLGATYASVQTGDAPPIDRLDVTGSVSQQLDENGARLGATGTYTNLDGQSGYAAALNYTQPLDDALTLGLTAQVQQAPGQDTPTGSVMATLSTADPPSVLPPSYDAATRVEAGLGAYRQLQDAIAFASANPDAVRFVETQEANLRAAFGQLYEDGDRAYAQFRREAGRGPGTEASERETYQEALAGIGTDRFGEVRGGADERTVSLAQRSVLASDQLSKEYPDATEAYAVLERNDVSVDRALEIGTAFGRAPQTTPSLAAPEPIPTEDAPSPLLPDR